jgi:hypothetical protein
LSKVAKVSKITATVAKGFTTRLPMYIAFRLTLKSYFNWQNLSNLDVVRFTGAMLDQGILKGSTVPLTSCLTGLD